MEGRIDLVRRCLGLYPGVRDVIKADSATRVREEVGGRESQRGRMIHHEWFVGLSQPTSSSQETSRRKGNATSKGPQKDPDPPDDKSRENHAGGGKYSVERRAIDIIMAHEFSVRSSKSSRSEKKKRTKSAPRGQTR